MRNKIIGAGAVIILLLLFSCSNDGLKGKYVNVWDLHQKGDAVSTYEFSGNGKVIQSIRIKPYEKLNFKGVDDTAEGTYELKEDILSITLDEGSYDMQVYENSGKTLVLGMNNTNGEMMKRTFIKE